MKNCMKCGTGNPDETNVCQRCGASLPPTTGRLCPKGIHIMDPSWMECEYCSPRSAGIPQGPAPDVQRRMTVVEALPLDPPPGIGQLPPRPGGWQGGGVEHTPLPPRPQRSGMPGGLQRPAQQQQPQHQWQVEESRQPTRIARPGPPSDEGSSSPGRITPPPVSSERRVVAILVSYSWVPEGQIFPVLEGRNLIGRGKCEISVPSDLTMSMDNSSITFRESFILKDRDSMSGTYLNGRVVEEQARLTNYSQIRAGSTVFTFVALDPSYLQSASPTGS